MSIDHRLNVFMAYQFRTSKFSQIDREYALTQAVMKVNDGLREQGINCSTVWQALDLESWHSVGSQVLDAIKQSAIFLADISEMNPNVLFELGFALGVRQGFSPFAIHLLAHDSLDIRALPSDLLGGHITRYSEDNFQVIIARLLKQSVQELLRDLTGAGSKLAWQDLWGLTGETAVDVICSEIPDETRPEYAHYRHPNYLRYAKFADLDSLIFIHELLASEFPSIRVRDYGATESIAQHEKGILIGGAAWNSRVQRIQHCLPFKFVDAQNPETDSLLVEADRKCWLFESTFSESGLPLADYYAFSRFSPDGRSCLLLFGGGLTHGVLGGIKTLAHMPPGPTNALYLKRWLIPKSDLVVIGCVYHRDGYLKAQDFSLSPPCLILRRVDQDPEFHVVQSACNCNVNHQR